MNRLPFAITILSLTALAATGCPSDGSGSANQLPFRDVWEVEADVDFPYILDDTFQITDITIGGRLTNDNFANRGDVIVNFTGAEGRIIVELRRFTMAQNQDIADDDFKALSLWAFNTAPANPDNIDDTNNCSTNGWMSGCAIRVYYDGLSQLARAGADIRVTLPPSYRHNISITTEDNDADADYHNRGNVCISNLNATATVKLGQGLAFVTLADDVTPMPICSPADQEACWNWNNDQGAAQDGADAWDNACPCGQVGQFGQVNIETHDAKAASLMVDVPVATNDGRAFWGAITIQNESDGQAKEGQHCRADALVAGYIIDETAVGTEATRKPWENKGFVGLPSDSATAGAGYGIQGRVKSCAPVTSTEAPEDFVGTNNGAMQDTDTDAPMGLRGAITVCNDCITAPCEQMLPGG